MIGYQFQPDAEKRLRNSLNTSAGKLPAMSNEALKILSLRIPNVLGGRPIAPDALLKEQMGGRGPGDPIARAVAGGAGMPSAAPSEMPRAVPTNDNPVATIPPPPSTEPSPGRFRTTPVDRVQGPTPTPGPSFGLPPQDRAFPPPADLPGVVNDALNPPESPSPHISFGNPQGPAPDASSDPSAGIAALLDLLFGRGNGGADNRSNNGQAFQI